MSVKMWADKNLALIEQFEYRFIGKGDTNLVCNSNYAYMLFKVASARKFLVSAGILLLLDFTAALARRTQLPIPVL